MGKEEKGFAEAAIKTRSINFRGQRRNQCNFLHITWISKIFVLNDLLTFPCTLERMMIKFSPAPAH